MDLNLMIRTASGKEESDLLLANAQIINVFSGKIVKGNIAIANGHICGIGNYSAKKIVNLEDSFVSPGFIDPHVHIESAMASVSEFTRTVISCGTTSVVADPHEIANILGSAGIQYMLDASNNQPVNVFYTLPSCVPATVMETAGAILEHEDLLPFIDNNKIVALAEIMNYPGVINEDPNVLKKIKLAKQYNKPVDGHSPGLSGNALHSYISAGILSDHECTTAIEAMEKLEAGMHIMVREGSGAKNLEALLPIVNEQTYHRIMWCTDDRHPNDLLEEGHIDSILRRAIKYGINPIMAIQMATINPANYFGLHNLGAIAPGRKADMVIFKDIQKPFAQHVYKDGKLTVENGKIRPTVKKPTPIKLHFSMNVKMDDLDLSISLQGRLLRVIETIPDQLITRQYVTEPTQFGNQAIADTKRDILKVSVIERHSCTGNIGKGFIRGFNLKKGALASSVAHDSHNIIAVGTNDNDMKIAIQKIVQMGGGLVAVNNQKSIASLALPIAGIMSNDPMEKIRNQLDNLIRAAKDMGCVLDDPFMTLSFLALPVIPELKITDKGLVDVLSFQLVSNFIE